MTIGLDGSYRLGPDVYFVNDRSDFSEPKNLSEKRDAFFEAASVFLTDLDRTTLRYDTCGIRPKLRSPTDQTDKDFVLSEDLPGFISLVGIESPGITASRDLAQRVCKILS